MWPEKPGTRKFRQSLDGSQRSEPSDRTEKRANKQFGAALNSQSMVSGVLFGRCLGQRMVDEFTDCWQWPISWIGVSGEVLTNPLPFPFFFCGMTAVHR